MTTQAILAGQIGAAPAAAESHAQAWLWRSETTSAAARLHRW
jgi:hypothetical protein